MHAYVYRVGRKKGSRFSTIICNGYSQIFIECGT